MIIPGIKDTINIKEPWYNDIDICIERTHPQTVDFDETQIDYR